MNEEFQLSLWWAILACPTLSFSLYQLYLWSLCHLELTRLQPARGIMWHKPQPRLYPFISASPTLSPSFALSVFSPVTHCHSLFYLLHPPWLALFLPFSLLQSSPLSRSALSPPQPLSHPIWQASGQPLLSPPSTAEHPLEHGQKINKYINKYINTTELSHVQQKDTTETPSGVERERMCNV